MVALLWELPGYFKQDVVSFVARTPEMTSAAGHRLGRLLAQSTVTQTHLEIGVSIELVYRRRADVDISSRSAP